MFVFGIVLGLPGAVLGLPDVAARLGLSLTIRGTLISSLFAGLFTGSAVSGPIVDRVGQRRALAFASVGVALCLSAFGAARSSLLAAIALVALGIAGSGINTAANALVSEWFPESRARRMNMISLAVGLGGLLLSVAAAISAASVPWQAIVYGAAALALVVGGVASTLTSPMRAVHHHLELSLLPAGLRQTHFALLAILLMLSSANEASMAGWTSTYLVERGLTPFAATWGLAAHWAGLIAGRLILGGRVDAHKREAVAAAAVAAACSVALLIGMHSRLVLFVMPAIIGVAISTVTPTLLALGGDRYPQFGGTVFGVLLTAAQLGAVIAPAAIGVIADRWSVRAGLVLLLLTSAGIALLVRKE